MKRTSLRRPMGGKHSKAFRVSYHFERFYLYSAERGSVDAAEDLVILSTSACED